MNEATMLTNALVDGRWGWLDWAIVGGLVLLLIGFIVGYALLTRNIFNRQLAVLAKAVDERSRALYLEHLPVVTAQIDREIARLERIIKDRVEEHDKDVLFLLGEQQKLAVMLEGMVPEKLATSMKMTQEEEMAQALKILLARIRREAM